MFPPVFYQAVTLVLGFTSISQESLPEAYYANKQRENVYAYIHKASCYMIWPGVENILTICSTYVGQILDKVADQIVG